MEENMLVAREKEQEILKNAFQDDRSHFIAVYGRRRVGKTFLVRETLKNQFLFMHSGLANGNYSQQLSEFYSSLVDAGMETDHSVPHNWMEAFGLLKKLIRTSDKDRKVIFIDELSWMDTRKSDLIMALESFWNGWASARDDIVLIICASATSWMLNKVIHNKGGLYNRLTDQIALEPFNLYECEQLLKMHGIVLDRYEILEGYMIIGGIPYYWEQFDKSLSLAQNIDMLFFARNARLKNEFEYLYASLFKNPEDYIKIVTALSTKKMGMSRSELSKATGLNVSGVFSKKLDELESCGFIRVYHAFGKKNRDSIIQLIDNYTFFYFQFLKNQSTDVHYWTNNYDSPERRNWSGHAFERVCLQHLPQILHALGITGVSSDSCAWQCKTDEDNGIYGSQIDLLIVRKDRVINVCEMKFSENEYAITKAYDEKLRHKISDFKNVTKSKYAIHLTLVTTYGLKRNTYSGRIQSCVSLKELFKDVD